METIKTTSIQEYKDIISDLCDKINEFKAREYEKYIPNFDSFTDKFDVSSADGYEIYLAGDAEKVIASLEDILRDLQINCVNLAQNGNYLIEAVNHRGVVVYSQQWHGISRDTAHGIAMGLSLGFGSKTYVSFCRFNDYGKVCHFDGVNSQPKNYLRPLYVYDGYFIIIDNYRAWNEGGKTYNPGYKFETIEEAETVANEYRQQHPDELVYIRHSSQINNQMCLCNLILPSFNHYKNI
jgi:hypothetical protein